MASCLHFQTVANGTITLYDLPLSGSQKYNSALYKLKTNEMAFSLVMLTSLQRTGFRVKILGLKLFSEKYMQAMYHLSDYKSHKFHIEQSM